MMQASMRALDYLKPVYFSAYLIATWVFTLLYGLNTIKRANTHYFLRIRFPSIVLGELVLFAGTSTIICLNELLWADKNPFPCFLTNLGSIGPPLVTTAIILTRSLQLFVVFDPAFRRAYHLHLPFIKVAIAWGTVWMLVLLMLLMQLQPMPFCHTPSFCSGRRCAYCASYYLVFLFAFAVMIMSTPVILRLRSLHIEEVAGYTSGVHGLVVTASSFQLGSGVVLGLVDFGLLSEGWTVVVSFGATLAFASFNFFLQVRPAAKYGFAPGRDLFRRPRRVKPAPLFGTRRARRRAPHHAGEVINPPGTPGAAGAALGQAETMAVAKQRLVQGREGREEAAGEGGDLTEHLTLQEICSSEWPVLQEAFTRHCRSFFFEEGACFLIDCHALLQDKMAAQDSESYRARLSVLCRTYLRRDGMYPLLLRDWEWAEVEHFLKWEGQEGSVWANPRPAAPGLRGGLGSSLRSQQSQRLLHRSLPLDEVVDMLRKVEREVERVLEFNILPAFLERDLTYNLHRPMVIAAHDTAEDRARRAEVNRRRRRQQARREVGALGMDGSSTMSHGDAASDAAQDQEEDGGEDKV